MPLKGMTEAEFRSLTKEQLVDLLKEEQSKTQLGELRIKVGTKGGISIGGLGQRFPTTLYAVSWLHLLTHAEEIRQFIEAHRAGKCSCEPRCPALADDR